MSIKLTDTQLAMLSAASQREDRCLVAPKAPKGSAAQKAGWNEIRARGKQRGAVCGERRSDACRQRARGRTDPGRSDCNPTATATTAAASAKPSTTAPRDGAKIAKVIGLLHRDDGATLDEVVAATGWLPHTTRAALTGLRKRGYAIERRLNATGAKDYVIVETPSASANRTGPASSS